MDKSTIRYGRPSTRDWGQNSGRGDLERKAIQDDPDPVGPHPRNRKNTRDNCKGKPGRPHKPVFARTQDAWSASATRYLQPGECGWKPGLERSSRQDDWKWEGASWRCCHVIRCSACGKHLEDSLPPERCPDYPGWPGSRQAAERAAIELEAAAQLRRNARESGWKAAYVLRKEARQAQIGLSGYRKNR